MANSIEDVAWRHGVSVEAVRALQDALRRGGWTAAQFSHPELGGMGQWSQGGMIQIGDMFNGTLKHKVAALCDELAQQDDVTERGASQPGSSGHDWWPEGLGRPASSGAQNGMRYAYFPEARRVAIAQDGKVTVHDSGDHRISGVSQSQSSRQELSFHSQHGTIGAADLPIAD